MANNIQTVSEFLYDVLARRRVRNPRYSLRAFARDLGISPGKLSDFLSERRLPGRQLAERIIKALALKDDEAEMFLKLLANYKSVRSEKKDAYELPEDQFSLVADRENFAILNLMQTDSFVSDVNWIAHRLGFTPELVQQCFDRLIRLGLVAYLDGKYVALHDNVITTTPVPSKAVREHHRQSLLYSMHSLEHDDFSLRDISTICVPTNAHQLSRAKSLIRDFQRKMAALLETGAKDEVYQLNVQLVPVTRISAGTETKALSALS